MDSSSFALSLSPLPPPFLRVQEGLTTTWSRLLCWPPMARNHSVLEWGLTHVKKLAWKILSKSISPEMYKQSFEDRLVFFVLFTKIMFTWFISQVCIFFLFSFIIYNQILSLKYKKYKWMEKKSAKKNNNICALYCE